MRVVEGVYRGLCGLWKGFMRVVEGVYEGCGRGL